MATATGASAEGPANGALTVDVDIACADDHVPSHTVIETWIARALAGAGRDPGEPAEIAVRVVGIDEMRELNSTYRGKDAPTNVLAFPVPPVEGLPADEAGLLGDVVICAEVVASEAAEQSKTTADHWAHLLVHGTLHLLGFDHLEDDDAKAMEALETRLLVAAGIADPYAD